ncbi:hypothetical protein AK812_SmicGene19977 [Symbiodinium microadriaticum]|uniref:Thioredoxin domain-containing protein n=1 Tax=Symbiodinium microadriaticum TaxID=2951 RepID=A0A1Q9DR55_SYMMI|nr:hypothetical protein AK812_SmicGene19977 [Symbiodinium microadriaticum]
MMSALAKTAGARRNPYPEGAHELQFSLEEDGAFTECRLKTLVLDEVLEAAPAFLAPGERPSSFRAKQAEVWFAALSEFQELDASDVVLKVTFRTPADSPEAPAVILKANTIGSDAEVELVHSSLEEIELAEQAATAGEITHRSTMSRWLLAAVAPSLVIGKVKIEAMEHDIIQIQASTFDGIISKFRDSSVSSLWFFKDDGKDDGKFLDEYNKVASDMKGMAKVCAINCNEYSVFCDKQGVKETPAVMIYPPNPVPAFKLEGKLEGKAVFNKLAKFMPDQTERLTKDNVDKFLTTDVTKPKALLFSNKKSVPLMWKALSSETVFKRTVKFGFVTEDQSDIVQRFKVKKFPTVLIQQGAKGEKKDTYSGEFNFLALKDWVNLHSESGMGDKVSSPGGAKEETAEEAKPWLVQEVPELTVKSHQDVCFKGEGLCVIFLKDGEASQAEIDMLTGLSKKYTSQLSDRGAKMKWMWMNLNVEKAYKDLFKASKLPSAAVFNPHKRLRFTLLDHGEDGEVKGDEQGIIKLLDKVLGGDARFTMVPGQKLPAWAQREAPAKKAEL